MKTLLHIMIVCLCFCVIKVSAETYHVSKDGNDGNSDTKVRPFLTIQWAASVAQPGDKVIVHTGVYRKQIDPAKGGSSASKRIIYTAAPGEKVEIKGLEVIRDWKSIVKGIWRIEIARLGGNNRTGL